MPDTRLSKTLRGLAFLLGYPDDQMRAHLDEAHAVIQSEKVLSAKRVDEISQLVQWMKTQNDLAVQGQYVECFDRGRSTSLHLFEHVHGDSRDRGPAMIDLAKTYASSGMYLAEGELPDYLPVVLEFASTLDAKDARSFLSETAHILNTIFSALIKRESPYASVVGAAIELAGERAQTVPFPADLPLDESWAEPVAFDGCSVAGQAKPGQPQPVHIVRNVSASQGVAP